MAYELSIGHGVPLLFMPGSKQANNSVFHPTNAQEKKPKKPKNHNKHKPFLYVFGEEFTSL